MGSEIELCLAHYQFKALDYGLVNIVKVLAEITNASEKIFEVEGKLQKKFEEAKQG